MSVQIKTFRGASKRGKCMKCCAKGSVRFFVAAKLPKPVCLCDRHYLMLRDALESALKEFFEILLEEGG